MSGYGYTIFDSAVGRCGIAWGELGILGVQLPEARELDTRRRMYRLYPEAREQRPPVNSEIAIEGIVAILRGGNADISEVALDMTGIPYFNQRVHRCGMFLLAVLANASNQSLCLNEVHRSSDQEGFDAHIHQT